MEGVCGHIDGPVSKLFSHGRLLFSWCYGFSKHRFAAVRYEAVASQMASVEQQRARLPTSEASSGQDKTAMRQEQLQRVVAALEQVDELSKLSQRANGKLLLIWIETACAPDSTNRPPFCRSCA